ncbi:MAG: threonylcarbamoyl-AMP synthase [Lachnospiraceae bacterium]|nr:threonylcarbamoyl-AMP synthase [Lachnospiraceae bacterium]
METKVITIDRKNPDKILLNEAGKLLKQGALVAFPTETVYGLGGDGLQENVAARIYAAKGRPSDNPLILHIADIRALEILAVDVPELAYRLAEKFWPGPLTMILKKSPVVPYATTGGLDTVAIRMPSDEIAKEIIRASGTYIAAPSANLSGRPSPTKAEHVIEDLSGRIEMIVDGGDSDIGLESSIIDLSGDVPMILRPGYITKEDFEQVVSEVEYDKAVLATKPQESVVAKAPGMKYRHYAPKGQITIVEGESLAVAKKINALVQEQEAKGVRVAVLCAEETKEKYGCMHVYSLGSLKSEKEISAHLFAALRSFDTEQMEVIYSESFEQTRLAGAIMNRLRKAAGYQTIQA